MTVAVSPEKAGATIAEWYSCIIARSVEQASQLKAKVDAMFKQIEKMNVCSPIMHSSTFATVLCANKLAKAALTTKC